MKRSIRSRIIASAVAILVLLFAAGLWLELVERWIGNELRSLASAHLNPTLGFDDLSYRFPRTVMLRGVRFTSPDPEARGESIDILTADSLSVALSEVPQPDRPIRFHRLDLAGLTLRFVRIETSEGSGSLLGYSEFLKVESPPAVPPVRPAQRLSNLLQVRTLSIQGGRVEFDPRDGSAAIMLIDGIVAQLLLHPSDAGAYAIEFSLEDPPVFKLALRGELFADEQRFDIDTLASTLSMAREQDHYFTPALQKFLAERDLTGRLTLGVKGTLDLAASAASHLQASFEVRDASYAAGSYRLALDQLDSKISAAGNTVSIEELSIDALGGHAKIGGTVELDDSLGAALSFEGADLQIADLLRGALDSQGVPAYSGLLGLSGTWSGPLTDIGQRAQGGGRLSLRKARLGGLPVLENIDAALDRAAEAAMKREHKGHDVLSLDFSFDGNRTSIGKLRMNSRWYGLRGHGDVFFDSRFDLTVEGGPVQRLENELGAVGDVLGELTDTLLRAHVTGTLSDPKVQVEVFRHGSGP